MPNVAVRLDKLPENLKAFRKHCGLSQRQVADILGIKSSATISNYENGRRSIPLDVLSRMADIYGFEVHFRLRGKCNRHRTD